MTMMRRVGSERGGAWEVGTVPAGRYSVGGGPSRRGGKAWQMQSNSRKRLQSIGERGGGDDDDETGGKRAVGPWEVGSVPTGRYSVGGRPSRRGGKA